MPRSSRSVQPPASSKSSAVRAAAAIVTRSARAVALRSDTIRILSPRQLSRLDAGFEVASGSQGGYSGPCPPPKNGEGSGCVTG
jgi:hypothetical protein